MPSEQVIMRFPGRRDPETGVVGPDTLSAVHTSRVADARKDYGAVIEDRRLSGFQRGARTFADILPTAGGVAGDITGKVLGTAAAGTAAAGTAGTGIVGAPVIIEGSSIAGAGLGSGLGQAGREGIYRAIGLGDAPGTVAGETAWGAGGAAGGRALLGGAKLGSRLLMNTSLGQNLAKNAEVVGNLIKARIPVGKLIPESITSLGERGSKLAKDAYLRALKLRDIALQNANIAGAQVERKSAADAVRQIAAKAVAEEDEKVAEALTRRLGRFTHQPVQVGNRTLVIPKPANFTPEGAQKVVTRYNKVLDAYYAKVNQGKPVPFDALPPKLQYAKTIADNLRDQLRNVVPSLRQVGKKGATILLDYETINKNLGDAIKMKDAVTLPEAMDWTRRLTASSLGTAGVGMAVGAAGGALTGGGISGVSQGAVVGAMLGASPELASRLALVLDNPASDALLRYFIPAAGVGLLNPSRRIESPAPRKSQSSTPVDLTGRR